MLQVKTMMSKNDVVGMKQNQIRQAEKLPTGESITKAIMMGTNGCCGTAYVEGAK